MKMNRVTNSGIALMIGKMDTDYAATDELKILGQLSKSDLDTVQYKLLNCETDTKRFQLCFHILDQAPPSVTRKHPTQKPVLLGRRSDKRFNPEVCLPKISSNAHKKNSSIIEAIDVESDVVYGRCLIATKTISPGEIVIIENPYAVALENYQLDQHCYHCLRECAELQICGNCSKARFCSEECFNDAFEQYHEIECPIMDDIVKPMDAILLSVRTLILASKKGTMLHEMKKILDNNEKSKMSYREKVALEGSLESIMELETHLDKRSTYYRIGPIATFAIIINSLKNKTSFFDHVVEENVAEIKITCGEALLKIFLGAQINSFWLRKPQFNSTALKDYLFSKCTITHEIFANGLYPCCSLLTHSCFPNCIKSFSYRGALIIKAVRSILPGETVTISYLHLANMIPKEQRHQVIQDTFFFTCSCVACKENWKPLTGIDKRILETSKEDSTLSRLMKEATLTIAKANDAQLLNVDIEKFLFTTLTKLIECYHNIASFEIVYITNQIEKWNVAFQAQHLFNNKLQLK